MRKTAAKPVKKPGVLARRRHALFMRRTYSIYKHMGERAKEGGTALTFTLDRFRLMVSEQVHLITTCQYCQGPIKEKTFSVDHARPISRGGSWFMDNLFVVCQSCNTAKGEMTLEEFALLLGLLKTFEPAVMKDILGRLKAGASIKRLRFLGRK